MVAGVARKCLLHHDYVLAMNIDACLLRTKANRNKFLTSVHKKD